MVHSIVKPPNVDKQVLGKAIIIIANYSLGKLLTNKKPHINKAGWVCGFLQEYNMLIVDCDGYLPCDV